MTLILFIENFDVLENGGPAQVSLTPRGCSIGRGTSMDWVLPDPGKHISSHHADIAFRDGAFWISDVSTNGTVLIGQHHRLEGPHQLAPGDRFQVGHYIVAVREEVAPPATGYAPGPTPPTEQGWSDDGDPWDAFGGGGGGGATPSPAPNPRPAPPVAEEFGSDDQFISMQQNQPTPQPMPTPQPGPGADAVLRAFCEGAGLPPEAAQGADPVALAKALGGSARVAVEEIMAMLHDRAAVKHFTRAGERTMLGVQGNNPMKFLTSPEEAVEALFLKPRQGFQKAPEGYASALSDIRAHQTAVFAAIQPALAQLLSGLAPDEIEDSTTGGSLFGGSGKAKAWETYSARWLEKADAGDNGMLDAFLKAYSEAYMKVGSGRA